MTTGVVAACLPHLLHQSYFVPRCSIVHLVFALFSGPIV